MIFDADELARAIFFFEDGKLVPKEMYYSEFEAVLDEYVPALEWANKNARAVYVEVDAGLNIRTAVFFQLPFTRTGAVDPNWNLPLGQLADNASYGPDLGAGPIKLACTSQCPIHHYRSFLWDPDLRKGKGHLAHLKKAVSENRLSLQFREPADEFTFGSRKAAIHSQELEQKLTQQLRREYAQEFRDHMAQLLKEQRLRVSTIDREKENVLEDLRRQHANQLEEYRELLQASERSLEEEKQRNTVLKDTIEGQAKKLEGLREYFEHKLEQAQDSEFDELQALKENYGAELEAKVEAATTELKELLGMKEVELLYRNERENQLQQEIDSLREENKGFVSNSGDQLLEKMMAKGISFVTYQPGAGHITVPVPEVSRFLENPIAYAAEYCGVRTTQYQAWLDHYQTPVCKATDTSGAICGENLERVESPTEFLIGKDDCCESHRQIKGVSKLKLAGV